VLTEIKAAFEGLKYAKEALTFGVNQKVDEKVRDKVGDALDRIAKVQDALFTLREKLNALQEENLALKEQLRQKENWDNTLSDYELVQAPGGAVVYQFKGTPQHFACPSCASKKELHILQDRKVISGIFDCPGCNNTFPVNQAKSAAGTVALKSRRSW
jgi:NAD-dependent SIR2 family protein deacetylase